MKPLVQQQVFLQSLTSKHVHKHAIYAQLRLKQYFFPMMGLQNPAVNVWDTKTHKNTLELLYFVW